MKNLKHALTLTCSVLLLVGLSTMAAAQTTFTVTSTADGNDVNPGDGVCDDGSGNCTLRAAIQRPVFTFTTRTEARPN